MIWLAIGFAAVAIQIGLPVLCLLKPAEPWRRAWAVGAYAVAMLFLGAVWMKSLGYAKPLEWEAQREGKIIVIAEAVTPDQSIYLWLLMPGETQPVAYSIPYSTDKANELMRARSDALANGTQVELKDLRGNPSSNQEPAFYADPQPETPEKTIPQDQPAEIE